MRKIFVAFLFLIILLCAGFTDNKANSSSKPALQKAKPLNSRIVQGKEFLIGGKAVLDLKYSEIIKTWGKPKKIRKIKVRFPATVEYSYLYILQFDSIDIEMYPVDNNVPVNKTRSFRFDITGSKYDFYGIKIGMSLEKYLKTVQNKDVLSVKKILRAANTDNFPYPFEYNKLLTQLKEKNYYINYDKAVYEQVVLNDFPHGAVMLFKNNTLRRIVYGFPNAD